MIYFKFLFFILIFGEALSVNAFAATASIQCEDAETIGKTALKIEIPLTAEVKEFWKEKDKIPTVASALILQQSGVEKSGGVDLNIHYVEKADQNPEELNIVFYTPLTQTIAYGTAVQGSTIQLKNNPQSGTFAGDGDLYSLENFPFTQKKHISLKNCSIPSAEVQNWLKLMKVFEEKKYIGKFTKTFFKYDYQKQNVIAQENAAVILSKSFIQTNNGTLFDAQILKDTFFSYYPDFKNDNPAQPPVGKSLIDEFELSFSFRPAIKFAELPKTMIQEQRDRGLYGGIIELLPTYVSIIPHPSPAAGTTAFRVSTLLRHESINYAVGLLEDTSHLSQTYREKFTSVEYKLEKAPTSAQKALLETFFHEEGINPNILNDLGSFRVIYCGISKFYIFFKTDGSKMFQVPVDYSEKSLTKK